MTSEERLIEVKAEIRALERLQCSIQKEIESLEREQYKLEDSEEE